jgi:SAM-dependent methyltransferase
MSMEKPANFEDMYLQGTPPWDIGQPQPAFVRLEEAGEIRGSVLDAGCGTGENAMYLAERGHPVLGIDAAPTAIARAKEKAAQRHSTAQFQVADALALDQLGQTFDTVIDSGVFHVFPDLERAQYVKSLASVVRPGGHYFMLVFSEHQPGTEGPRRVSQAEIRAAFKDGWTVTAIEPAQFAVNPGMFPNGVVAWLAKIRKD